MRKYRYVVTVSVEKNEEGLYPSKTVIAYMIRRDTGCWEGSKRPEHQVHIKNVSVMSVQDKPKG